MPGFSAREGLMQFRFVLGFLIGLGILLNLVQFRAIDQDTRHNYSAVHMYHTHDLFAIAINEDNSARRWVAPFRILGQNYPRSELIVPEGTGLGGVYFNMRTAGLTFGKARHLREAVYNPEQLPDVLKDGAHRVDLRELIDAPEHVIRVMDERFAFHLSENPSGVFVLFTPAGRPWRFGSFHLVDLNLVPHVFREGEADGK